MTVLAPNPVAPKRASLEFRIWRFTVISLAVKGAAFFLAAGSAGVWQGWLYLAISGASMAVTNLYLAKDDRGLLERRMKLEDEGETEPIQRRIQASLPGLLLAVMVVAGLDHRFNHPSVPAVALALGVMAYGAGSAGILWVFRANAYAAVVIQVEAGQPVVATGPYRLVRHPMYAAVLVMGFAMALLLGSLLAEACMVPAVGVIVLRLLAEERYLRARLAGYAAYLDATRWRLVPGVW
jgi:protein-S-isoprenylcysteine O-methyltransferase Ste14